MLVMHDPGHGQIKTIDGHQVIDKGARAIAKSHGKEVVVEESELVLGIAIDAHASIPWAASTLLRTGESGPSYSDRADEAKRRGADIVLIHHANASDNPSAHGLMTFYSDGDDLARDVASSIARSAPVELFRGNATVATRQAWPRVKNVLDVYRERSLSAVLIEWGFLTNDHDLKILTDMRYRPAFSACVAVGLARAMIVSHDKPGVVLSVFS